MTLTFFKESWVESCNRVPDDTKFSSEKKSTMDFWKKNLVAFLRHNLKRVANHVTLPPINLDSKARVQGYSHS